MSSYSPLKIALITINDTLYAPKYIDNILKQLKGVAGVQISQIYVLGETRGHGLWKQVKRRLSIYGLSQFAIFMAMILKTWLLAEIEKIWKFQRPYH